VLVHAPAPWHAKGGEEPLPDHRSCAMIRHVLLIV